MSDLAGARPALPLRAGSPGVSPAGGPDDGTWALLAGSGGPINGPGRLTHASIHDPVRHRVVIFGGTNGSYLNDTWALDVPGSEWLPLATQGDPPPVRRLHSAIYDSQHDRMVVFGGYDGGFYSDVWTLSFQTDPPTWSQLVVSGNAPPPRAGHAAVYDADDHRMIVFAGYDGVSASDLRRNDVWSLSLGGNPAWTDITPQGDSPGVRSSLDAAYDSQRDRMLIFGGTGPGFLDDTWALDLDGAPSWSSFDIQGTRPPAREEHSAVYDAANDRLVIHGGYDDTYYLGDTWALSLSAPTEWTDLQPGGLGPGPLWGQTAVYDDTNGNMILFGGYTLYGPLGETFILDLSGTPAWSNPVIPPGPGPVRHTFASAHDSQRHRLLLFGGSSVATVLNDTWAINLEGVPQWSSLSTAGTPPTSRRLCEAIYDPVGDRMIVYGGYDGAVLGDLHQLSFATDPPTWSPLAASGDPPPARAGHGLIYDLVGRRMIVFGGWDGVPPDYRINDVWALNLGQDPDWEELSPEGTPPSPRSSPSAVYDRDRRELLVFGGTTPDFQNDVWSLSLNGAHPAWTQVQASGTPPTAREEQSAVYDPVRDRLVIFGGYINGYYQTTQDAWALSLRHDPVWTELAPLGPQPPVRWGHAAIYDAAADRMIMHGGLGPGLDQTWALSWGTPESAAPTLIETESGPGLVRLTWGVEGGSYFEAAVYRSENDGSWIQADDIPIDAAGHAVFEDHAVLPGTRYGYRAGVKAGDTEKLSTPTYVDVAGTTGVGGARTGLAIFSSRPAGAELTVWLSLENDTPAHLAMLDVGGRTVAARDLSGRGAGSHQISLSRRGGITPGVYWLRLRQAGKTASAKTVVWR
jgi:hypothetical protein